MGYFSELDIELQTYTYGDQSCLDELWCELHDLQNWLDDLEEMRPHDPMDPDYDRYFYEDHITERYELADTVEGLLRQMDTVRSLIREEEDLECQRAAFVKALVETGATPRGQFVIPLNLYPLSDFNTAAA